MRRLPSKAQELLDLLTGSANAVAKERGWSPHTTLVSLFIPQSAVALALDVDPSTIRRWLYRYPQLRERVATAAHYGSISAGEGSRTVIDGLMWTVRLGEGPAVRSVPIEALQHQYRNLDFDIREGATLRKSLEERKLERARARAEGLHASSVTGLGSPKEKINYFLGWVFGDRALEPVGSDACKTLEEAVGAVEEGADASVLARVVGRLLRDRHSFRFWVRQVRAWRERGRLSVFADAVRRVLVDVREGFARSAAALLVTRLTAGGASRVEGALASVEGVRVDEDGVWFERECAFEDALLPVAPEGVLSPSPRVAALLASLQASLDAVFAAPAPRAGAIA